MDEVINYVMETPGNTNPNVLRSMLNNSSGSSDGIFKATFSGLTSNDNASCDKTFEEFLAAYEAGKLIKIYYQDDESGQTSELLFSMYNESLDGLPHYDFIGQYSGASLQVTLSQKHKLQVFNITVQIRWTSEVTCYTDLKTIEI